MVSSIYQLLKDAGWYPNESKEIVFNSLVPAFSIEDLNNIFNGVFEDSILAPHFYRGVFLFILLSSRIYFMISSHLYLGSLM